MEDRCVRQEETVESLTDALAIGWDERLAANVLTVIQQNYSENPSTVKLLIHAACRALETVPPESATELMRENLFCISRLVYHDESVLGLGAARRGIALSRASKAWTYRFLHLEGTYLSDSGRFDEALESLTRAFELAREERDFERVDRILLTTACTCVHSFRYSQAEEIYERLRIEGLGQDIRAVANGNLACLVFETDVNRALILVTAALEEISTSTDFSKGNITATYLWLSTRIFAALGRTEEMLEAVQQAAQLAASCAPDTYICRLADLARARALCATGGFGEGVSMMKKILEVERAEGRGGLARDTLVVLEEVYERHGHPQEALECLREEFALNAHARRAQIALERRFGEQMARAGDDTDLWFANRRALLEQDIQQRISARTELAVMAGLNNGYDELHVYRRGRLAALTAKAAGWSAQKVLDIVFASQLVDIGTIAVPEKILRRPTSLTEAERLLVNRHAFYGVDLLESAKLPVFDTAVLVARHYQEHWDGAGCPTGLLGEAIPIEARLVALCDVFEAMTHDRPWRKANSVFDALKEIESLAGSRFDPLLTKVFVASVREAFSNTPDWEGFLSQDGESSPFVRTKNLLARLARSQREGSRA